MISYTNAQCAKNKNKIIQSKYHNNNNKKKQNPSETMPLTVPYHGPNTTSRV